MSANESNKSSGSNRDESASAHHTHCRVPGDPVSTQDKSLGTASGLIQEFGPLKSVCVHLNAIHTYADEPGRLVETDHYCAHVTDKVRQCLLYDGPGPDARLLGIEYLVTEDVFATLAPDERRLWHSHVYEVKSGMLVMPAPAAASVPGAAQAWEAAETAEMRRLITWYGKIYQLWQADRDPLPLGPPRLMTTFTDPDQPFDFEKHVGARDKRTNTDWRRKKELRKDIPEPNIHPDADQAWK